MRIGIPRIHLFGRRRRSATYPEPQSEDERYLKARENLRKALTAVRQSPEALRKQAADMFSAEGTRVAGGQHSTARHR